MKLKKLIAIFLLAVLFVAQFSWIHVEAAGSGVEANFHYEQLGAEAKKIYQAMYNMYTKGVFKTGTQGYDLVDNGFFTEDEIKEYEKYTQTKQYIEEVAKDKLGLVHEGEILFKDDN